LVVLGEGGGAVPVLTGTGDPLTTAKYSVAVLPATTEKRLGGLGGFCTDSNVPEKASAPWLTGKTKLAEVYGNMAMRSAAGDQESSRLGTVSVTRTWPSVLVEETRGLAPRKNVPPQTCAATKLTALPAATEAGAHVAQTSHTAPAHLSSSSKRA
jgi:hypothetical protein